jgi:hypothetical protein
MYSEHQITSYNNAEYWQVNSPRPTKSIAKFQTTALLQFLTASSLRSR